MKIKNYVLIVLMLLAYVAPIEVCAQDQDSLKLPRWEVGVDLLSLVDKNTYPEYSLFGRYRLNPTRDKAVYLRTRIGYTSSVYLDSLTAGNPVDYEERNFSPFIMLGLQKDLLNFGESRVYFATDISYSRKTNTITWGPIMPERFQFQEGFQNIKENFFGFHLSVGYSHYFGQHIKLSIESSLNLIRRNYFLDEEIRFYEDGSGIGAGSTIRENSSTEILTSVKPLHQILLTFNL
jgi:hypothetical protein